MHQLIEDHLEELLSGAGLPEPHPVQQHLKSCADCAQMVGQMRAHGDLLRSFAVEEELEPHPGFYARVRERIEAQKPVSIWDGFAASILNRGLAAASLALVLSMGAYLVAAETSTSSQTYTAEDVLQRTYPMLPDTDFPDEVLAIPAMAVQASGANRGAVLMNLTTYHQEQ